MRFQKIYVKPAIEVIHMIEEGGLCNFTKDPQNGYGYENDKKRGHGVSSFGDSFGDDYFGSSSAKAWGAEPVGESTYDTLEH